MKLLPMRRFSLILALLMLSFCVQAQFLMDMVDTTKDLGKGMLNMYNRYDRLKFSGYIQPEFQVASSKGSKSYEGGDFAPAASNRFMLRRSRIRLDYVRSTKDQQPSMQFVFQFDATERGVNVRDVWARFFDNKYKRFSFTTGVFARPFGYEVNLSSSDRESPERGRMSQILMKTERDLGAMVSLEPRGKTDKLRFLKIDLGLFNGQGLAGPNEYDSYKDLIGRIALKPYPLGKKLTFSAGASLLEGGLLQNTKYRYSNAILNGVKYMQIDSSSANVGTKNRRSYRGADMQLKWKHSYGFTEIRGEYWAGTQTGSFTSSETPGVVLTGTDAYCLRPFAGGFVYLLQNVVSTKHQLGLKLDVYDPNTKVSGTEIGKAGSNLNASNIKYTTYAVGYNYYVNENVKWMFWYHRVTNENTALSGYTSDVKDNIFTCRLQYRF